MSANHPSTEEADGSPDELAAAHATLQAIREWRWKDNATLNELEELLGIGRALVSYEPHRALDAVKAEAAATALESAATDWAADPAAWGDNDKDYRNTLRERAAAYRVGDVVAQATTQQ
ncbi:hypothetical protein [Curtobacterium sp. MCSS17_016]|uniref:hypothetical protein n=1 Tax=Curtobacterium sp. MCSS17_016 TaxID=2175644 RepID=UPI000DA95AE2|nr:hypothetical protein [Curtobacterium sp. MCSS17_016]WIE81411.1 hypothetical protein DEJ19_019440 [Curtobacterium sp. MCSS17_016]